MSDLAIVIMAAGLGSRFGGNKQLVDVGPNGEAFFDFAIADARAAGADRVVLIVRREFAHIVEDHVRKMHGDVDLHLVCQDDSDAPPRKKPWGTAHAILSAAKVVDRPFVVVNADDYFNAVPLVNKGNAVTTRVLSEKPEALPSEMSASRSRMRGSKVRRRPLRPVDRMRPFSS